MNHLKQIAENLPEYGIDALLITSDAGEFYAVGMHGEGAVLVTAKNCHYITDSRYIELAGRAATGAEVTMTTRAHGMKAVLEELLKREGVKKLGFEDGYMTVAAHADFAASFSCDLLPAQKLLSQLRAAKDAEEIECLTKAQRIAERALDEILKFVRPGVTEKEIAAKLVYDMLRFGADKMSFDPIVATGANGSLPHAIPTDRVVESGSFVTMDFGCMFGGYCSDMTRTVAVGTPTEEMKTVYNTVLAAQLAGIAATKAGVSGVSIDAAARKVIEDAGYGDCFGHGYGHSVGLEIHEGPNANSSDATLMPVGAAVSAEPGIYLPGKFGVRIEDVVIVTETGCTNLTLAAKELIIL